MQAGSQTTTMTTAESEVRRFYSDWKDCINGLATEPAAGLAYFNDPPDVGIFDLMTTAVEGEKFIEHWWQVAPFFANGTIEFQDVKVHASDTVAFVTMLQHYQGMDGNGNPFNFRYRVTDGLQKIDGRWRIVHEHISFPIDLETQKADLLSER